MGTNEFERRRWNDERWVAVWPKRERLTDAISDYLLDAAALRRGERVLDIGCGGGKTSMAAARLVGGEGMVVGADFSAPLSQLAGQRAAEAGLDNVDFRVLDVQTDTIEGGPFDVAISQFGVMFFDEPITAFRNVRAQLRPGGRRRMSERPSIDDELAARLLFEADRACCLCRKDRSAGSVARRRAPRTS